MDFGLSEDQQLLYDTVRSFLAERVPIARVRELEERDSPNDREVWQGLAELGVAGILVPEKQGLPWWTAGSTLIWFPSE